MTKIVSAPFHPGLEEALVTEIESAKRHAALRPLAIFVPSQQLARRVKWLLAVTRGQTLLDVHVLTFHQLALLLLRENHSIVPALVPFAFREELLRSLVGRELAGLESFKRWTGTHGVWGAIWATMQDLKEARVDPATALSALQEGLIGRQDPERLKALLHLYALVLETYSSLGIADPDDLAGFATPHVPRSVFLRRLEHIHYYGFYDLTQSQLDFFMAVTSAYPATVYFPLDAGNPVYRFGQRFFDTHLAGLSKDAGHRMGIRHARTFSVSPRPILAAPGMDESAAQTLGSFTAEMAPEVRGSCRVFSAVGLEDEIVAVAKEILRLIEDQAIDPIDIGVIARTLDPVLPVLHRVFQENRIPWACPMGMPLIEEPLVKILVRFLGLRSRAYARVEVMDVLTSPFCRAAAEASGMAVHPDEWDWLTRRLGITGGDPQGGGIGEWARLASVADQDVSVPDDDGRWRHAAISKQQTCVLWRLVSALHADLEALPLQAGWGEYATAFLGLLPRWFDLPAWTAQSETSPEEQTQLSIRDCLRAVGSLDLLGKDVSLQQWCEHLVRALEGTRLPSESRTRAGVQVLDAMDARGIPFRAMFIMELNEKVFPRSVQEDAFLRDADREALAQDLGYKIPRKLDGFDEERLLFALLLRGARERLYLSYQRADRTGRALAASGYLAEVLQELGDQAGESVIAIRRRPTEQWSRWPYDPRLLTLRERALQTILEGGAPASLTFMPAHALFMPGVSALAAIDGGQRELGAYDGMIGAYDRHWARLAQKGVSPTALERYARCPFQYFAGQVLRLLPLPTPESVSELDARTRGQLCHAVLRAFYERVHKSGQGLTEMPPLEALQWLSEEASLVFDEFARTESTGYPLLWDLAKEEISALTQELVLSDVSELAESGYVPSFFERELVADIPFPPAADHAARTLRIRGVLDRIDARRIDGDLHLRVVDYKYTQRLKPDATDLALAAVRGIKLQPALYLEAVKSVLPGERLVPESAQLYFLGPRCKETVHRHALHASCWEGSTGALLRQTLQQILDGIRQGRFAILPNPDYCPSCDFSAACRFRHDPSRRRARMDPEMKMLKDLRGQQLGQCADDLPQSEPALDSRSIPDA